MVIDKQYPSIILYPSPQTLYCPVQEGGFCGYWIGERGGAWSFLPLSLSHPHMHLYQREIGGHVDSELRTVEKHDGVQVWALYSGQRRYCPDSERAGRPHGFLRALRTALSGRAYRLNSIHFCRLHLSRRERGNRGEHSACTGTWTCPGYCYCNVWRDQVSELLGILFTSSN